MATYKSNLVTKKAINRALYEGKDEVRTGKISLKAGQVLAAADVLLGVPLGENQIIKKIGVTTIGATTTLAASAGTFQIIDKDGNALVVERKGRDGDATFTSPASAPTALKTATALAGYFEQVIGTPAKLAGPVNVGLAVTTGETLANDVDILIAVTVAGEISDHEITGWDSDSNDYLIS
jgi:hypothetical protein